ncbi:hypothetical protein ACWEN6_13645 [Sphaerisporangium sp. NPDC004334]
MRHVEYMPLSAVPRARRNPKDHDLAAIRRSIEKFGCVIAGELDERTGNLVVGHGRLEVLERMSTEGAAPVQGIQLADDGTWLAPIIRGWASRSDADAEAYLIANNHTSERGGWLEEMLVEVLDDIAGVDADLLAATGYSDKDLENMRAALEDEETLPEPDDADTDERPAVWGVVVTCENEDQQVELLERLTKQGYQVRALM